MSLRRENNLSYVCSHIHISFWPAFDESPGQSSQRSSRSLQKYIYLSNNFHSIDHSKLEIAKLLVTWILAKPGGYQQKTNSNRKYQPSLVRVAFINENGLGKELHEKIKQIYGAFNHSYKIDSTTVTNSSISCKTKSSSQISLHTVASVECSPCGPGHHTAWQGEITF